MSAPKLTVDARVELAEHYYIVARDCERQAAECADMAKRMNYIADQLCEAAIKDKPLPPSTERG
jgi:hypothetical protein